MPLIRGAYACLALHRQAADTDPPSAWATLPIDVIGLIMAHHTQYARIHALSCVCKRWRTAALRSVTKLRAASCDNAIALFPSLRSLALWRPVAGLSLPAGLTKLVMGCQANLLGVASVPPLRSLKLSFHCNFFALEPLFTSVQSSLTALDLDGFIDDGKRTTVAEYEDYFSAHPLDHTRTRTQTTPNKQSRPSCCA